MAAPAGASRGRRTRRSTRVSVALALLVLAALVVVAAVVLREPTTLSVAAVLAVVAGAVGYRLLRGELVATRRECATERRDLARSYRELFDQRADESAAQHQRLANRLTEEQRTVVRLRDAVGTAERRAQGTASMLDDVRRRLGEAEERYAAMAAYAVSESPEDEATIPVPVAGTVAGRDTAVPEWARMEADPVQALLAWEEHAGRVTGSHRTVEDRKRA